MCPRIFKLKYLLICFCATHLINGRLQTSSPRFEAFFSLDDHIVSGLGRYVRHETNRLHIIKNSSGYEDEVPIVEERIELLKDFYERAQENVSAINEDIRLLRAHHPTSSFVAVKNFVLNWMPLLQNETRYGFRLLEFLNVSSNEIPNYEDVTNLRGEIVNIQTFYNLSVSDIYKGNILGVKGVPLTITDAHDIGRHAQNDRKLRQALEWFQLVVDESKKANNKTGIDLPLVLTDLAMMHYQMDDIEKAQAIATEAYALNDTNDVIYKRFLRIDNENVEKMADFDEFAPNFWKNFTEICQANSTFQLKPMRNKYYHNYDGTQVKDFPDSGRLLSHLASEISGLNATYTPDILSSGSPMRILKFGFGGKAYPHSHKSMRDPAMRGAGRMLASVEFYLSDVDIGGATVFLDVGVRYQPRKGSALLWFHIQPNWNQELRLTTAECALAIGEKWTVQKDIYTLENRFARPCARKELGNQIGVDRAVHRFRHCGF